MSQTTGGQCPIPSPAFNAPVYQYIAGLFQDYFAIVGLLGGLYGVLAVLSVQSICALVQRARTARYTAIVLCITILALFTSTTIHTIITILSYQNQVLMGYILSAEVVWTYGGSQSPDFPLSQALLNVKDYSTLQTCVSTAALTVNITLGDAIVCWRACVVWHKNRAVRTVCLVFLLATFALGMWDTASACHPTYREIFGLGSIAEGIMYMGFPAGMATCVLSLSTNVVATLLICYKAWESRKRLQGYLVARGHGGCLVEKLFALLIESGAIYCALWAVVVAFEVATYQSAVARTVVGPGYDFLNVLVVFVEGALVPLIAIYPTAIVVLVALNKSQIEKGLTQNGPPYSLNSLPTPRIAITVDTVANIHRDRRRSGMLDTDRQGVADGEGLEDTRSEEGKVKGII